MPRLFTAFEQGEKVTVRQRSGLGLGSAIWRKIVELHDGAIEAASPGPGGAATFLVGLPTLTANVVPRTAEPPTLTSTRAEALDIL